MVLDSADAEGISTSEAHGQTQGGIQDETLMGLGPIVEYFRAQEPAERTAQQIQETEMEDSKHRY
ncbi:hypothetical protein KNSL1_013696, partial [Colletotrichum chrysophilum]